MSFNKPWQKGAVPMSQPLTEQGRENFDRIFRNKQKRRVLIIKTGHSEILDHRISDICSLGDVLRCTVILHQFKNDNVTWLTDPAAYDLLIGNPYISTVTNKPLEGSYDVVVNLEKDISSCMLTSIAPRGQRYGFGYDETTREFYPYTGSMYLFSVSKNSEIKKYNQINGQQLLVEAVGGRWEGQEYILGYKPKSQEIIDVGLNWAVGKKFPEKAWSDDSWATLGGLLRETGYICSMQQGLSDLKEYIEWINSCKIIVTTDSLGMHLALALGKPLVALYGPTNPDETYFYGLGEIIKRDYMNLIKPHEVVDAVKKQMKRR